MHMCQKGNFEREMSRRNLKDAELTKEVKEVKIVKELFAFIQFIYWDAKLKNYKAIRKQI